mgnify:CR=1 FL=1
MKTQKMKKNKTKKGHTNHECEQEISRAHASTDTQCAMRNIRDRRLSYADRCRATHFCNISHVMQTKKRKECQKLDEEKEEIKEEKKKELDIYIIGSEKFPIPANRWGYLPISVQKFLKFNNKNCQISIFKDMIMRNLNLY